MEGRKDGDKKKRKRGGAGRGFDGGSREQNRRKVGRVCLTGVIKVDADGLFDGGSLRQ